jgi:hypothetical protein
MFHILIDMVFYTSALPGAIGEQLLRCDDGLLLLAHGCLPCFRSRSRSMRRSR